MKGYKEEALGELMVDRLGSVDPSKHPDEVFDLYSIPAYDTREPEVVAGHEIGSSKKLVEPHDVLLSRIVPHIRRSWIVQPRNARRQIASGEWIVFRSNRFHPSFIRHFLMGNVFHAQFMSTVAGVGGSLLRARPAHVAKITIPLPPLSEQKRIAAILDQADTIRRRRRQAIEELAALRLSIFYKLFGTPFANGNDWPVVPVAELGVVQAGITINSRRNAYGLKVPYLRVANVFRDRLDLTEIKTVGVTDAESERTTLQSGDILVVEGHGNPEEIGRCAVWDGAISPCSHQNHLIRIRPNQNLAMPNFLSTFLNSPEGRRQLIGASKTTSGLNTISVSNVRSTTIELPPLKAQQGYEAALQQHFALEASLSNSLEDSEKLFASLVQLAFKGDL